MQANLMISSFVSLRASEKFRQFLTLGYSRVKEAWEMYPSQVNAYYNPPANEVCYRESGIDQNTRLPCSLAFQIVFPAGILRPPFFNEHW